MARKWIKPTLQLPGPTWGTQTGRQTIIGKKENENDWPWSNTH